MSVQELLEKGRKLAEKADACPRHDFTVGYYKSEINPPLGSSIACRICGLRVSIADANHYDLHGRFPTILQTGANKNDNLETLRYH